MNKIAALVLAGFSLVVVACSGGDDENHGSTAAALTVVEACSATVFCKVGDDTEIVALSKQAAGCRLRSFTLVEGGVAVVDDLDGVTWTSTESTITISHEGEPSIECTDPHAKASATPASGGGKCTGSSWSCSGSPAGSCGSQDGCTFTQHTHIMPVSGDIELRYECEGHAKECDEYDSQKSCEGQRGCTWK